MCNYINTCSSITSLVCLQSKLNVSEPVTHRNYMNFIHVFFKWHLNLLVYYTDVLVIMIMKKVFYLFLLSNQHIFIKFNLQLSYLNIIKPFLASGRIFFDSFLLIPFIFIVRQEDNKKERVNHMSTWGAIFYHWNAISSYLRYTLIILVIICLMVVFRFR